MRRFATLLTTLALAMSGMVFSPANAETVSCSGGGSFTISSGEVSGGDTCRGIATIPASVTSIGNYAFYYATSLATISFAPNSLLASIGNGAFSGATILTSITIPASVTSIGDSAFRSAGLISITVDNANANYRSTEGVLFNNASTMIIAYPKGKVGTSYSIPATVTSIASNAFSGADLTSIAIPSSVASIGESAFENSDVTSITIPSGVTSIEFGTFYNATSLTSITIPASVASIGRWAFQGCASLASIIIPANVTSIADEAFRRSSSLTSVYFLGNAPATIGTTPFSNTASGARAYQKTGATGFAEVGLDWKGLIVTVWTDSAASPVPVIANSYRADNLGSVYFAPRSSKLSKAAKKQIDSLVAANPAAIYKVSGYVQKSIFAKNAKNDASLSLARARAVETYLVSLGAGVNFTVVVDAGKVPTKNGKSNKARRATLYAMTPVAQ